MDECAVWAFLFLIIAGASIGFGLMGGQIRKLRQEIEQLHGRLTAYQNYMRNTERQPKPEATETPETPAVESPPKAKVVYPQAPPVAPAQVSRPAQTPAMSRPAPATPTPPPPSAPTAPTPPLKDSSTIEWIEQNIGQRWLTWVGALVLFLAAAFFIKYAFDHDWLGPTARVAFGLALGMALTIAGDRFMRKQMRILGQGLIGSGLGVLILSIYAALSFYALVSQGAAFAGLIGVTVAGMALAVLHDAPAISILALLGGMLTPLLVSKGVDNRDVLFAYLCVLDLGALGVAFFRRWRALDVLAFVGSAVLFIGWSIEYYTDEAVLPTMLWLSALYVIFLVSPFLYHLRRREAITLERFLMAMANAVFYFIAAYIILEDNHEPVLSLLTLAMSAAYLGLGVLTRKRLHDDELSASGFIILSVMFLTLTIPLHFDLYNVTLLFALEAPVLLALGHRFRYLPVRIFGMGVLAMTIGRLFFLHMPLHEQAVTLIFNSDFLSAMGVPLSAFACAIINRLFRDGDHVRDADRLALVWSAIGGAVLTTVLLHVELFQWFDFRDHDYLARVVPPAIWSAGALALLWAGVAWRRFEARGVGLLSAVIAILLIFLNYADSPESMWMVLNVRFLLGLVAVGLFFVYAEVSRRRGVQPDNHEHAAMPFIYGAAIILLLVLLSLEAGTYNYSTDDFGVRYARLMAVSIVWGVYALAALIVGFALNLRALRLGALALFGLTAAKLILVDMAGVKQIYRIVTFFVLGGVMLGASYVYQRWEKRLRQNGDVDPK